jgi:hypothetical protein
MKVARPTTAVSKIRSLIVFLPAKSFGRALVGVSITDFTVSTISLRSIETDDLVALVAAFAFLQP